MFDSIEETTTRLARHDYLAGVGLATSVFLALRMEKALFLEGEPGVGKTEVAKVLAAALETRLIRLQCYEGLDLHQAVYEWNYPRQLLEMQAAAGGGHDRVTADIFTEPFLLKRPLLEAIDPTLDRAPVLLVDEIDRSDEEFESYLLELLSDFQVTVPELGTIRARHRPVVIITSNRTREVHDALKRRCVYHWIDYPSADRELEIVHLKAPGIGERLAQQVVCFVQAVRDVDLYKAPGVAETLDWAVALQHLAATELDERVLDATLGLLVKYQDDVERLRGPRSSKLLQEAIERTG